MGLQPYLLTKIPLDLLFDNLNQVDAKYFSLFQIPFDTIMTNKFQFMVQLRMPTTVVDSWYYWEFEEYIKLLNEKNKEEEKQRKEEESKQKSSQPSSFNPNKLMNSMPKMPNIPKF